MVRQYRKRFHQAEESNAGKTATVTTRQMKAVSEEVKQIKLNIVHLANTKDQRGNAVFGGTMGSGDAFT